jgi:hypothetical protein
VAIAGGYLHSAALLSNRTVVVWGDNSFGQTNVPAGLANVVAIAAGDFDTYALLSNGTVVGWGDDSYGQTGVPGSLTNVMGIAAGNYHGLALTPTAGMLLPTFSKAGLVLHWAGTATLQWAPVATGPFMDLPISGNSYTNTDMTTPGKFFRLRR